jgi:hypothetical protein
MIELNTK